VTAPRAPASPWTGTANRVVTIVITANTVYSAGVMMPAVMPASSRTSSMRPRAFIRAPTDTASRHGVPVYRLASVHAPPLLSTATRVTATVMARTAGVSWLAGRARSPASTKKTGSRTETVTGASRS